MRRVVSKNLKKARISKEKAEKEAELKRTQPERDRALDERLAEGHKMFIQWKYYGGFDSR